MGTLRHILLLVFCLALSFGYAQEEETISWSPDRKLQWEDFKGRPFKTAWAAAVTASGITYEFSSVETNGKLKLDIEIKDRFGKPVKPNEWFLVPIFIIDEMVDKIKDGSISDYYYDPSSAELKKYEDL